MSSRPSDQTSKVPIAGWLILPAIGTHLAPFYAIYSAIQDIQGIAQLPESASPQITAFVILDAVCTALLTVGWCIAIVLFHKRNRRFPDLFMWLTIATFALTGLEVGIFYRATQQWDQELITAFMRAMIAMLIWAPYMVLSNRVNYTFRGIGSPPPIISTAPKISPKPAPPYRAKAHRMGIFVMALSFIPLVMGAFTAESASAFSAICFAVGSAGLLFGYAIVRLWFWATNG
jgi:hypothetical protein